MTAERKTLRIAVIGPRALKWSAASDISIVAAGLTLMGHTVVALGDTGDTNLALKRGAADVGTLIEVAPNSLPELDTVDCAIIFERPAIKEEVNDLGIIVDKRWVYLQNEEELDKFADAAVNLLANEGVII